MISSRVGRFTICASFIFAGFFLPFVEIPGIGRYQNYFWGLVFGVGMWLPKTILGIFNVDSHPTYPMWYSVILVVSFFAWVFIVSKSILIYMRYALTMQTPRTKAILLLFAPLSLLLVMPDSMEFAVSYAHWPTIANIMRAW